MSCPGPFVVSSTYVSQDDRPSSPLMYYGHTVTYHLRLTRSKCKAYFVDYILCNITSTPTDHATINFYCLPGLNVEGTSSELSSKNETYHSV